MQNINRFIHKRIVCEIIERTSENFCQTIVFKGNWYLDDLLPSYLITNGDRYTSPMIGLAIKTTLRRLYRTW